MMENITDDMITGFLLGGVERMIKEFYAPEIELLMKTEGEDAPGLDDVIYQVSAGHLGYGGVEYAGYKTSLEQALQSSRRADKFIEHITADFERWVSEHAEFLRKLIRGPLAEAMLSADVDRVRKLAELLEKKQDAFHPMLIAVYALGPGWNKVFAEQ
jgi:hypothetical protein